MTPSTTAVALAKSLTAWDSGPINPINSPSLRQWSQARIMGWMLSLQIHLCNCPLSNKTQLQLQAQIQEIELFSLLSDLTFTKTGLQLLPPSTLTYPPSFPSPPPTQTPFL